MRLNPKQFTAVTRKPATMAGEIVMRKLIFRLFFANELRKMARARQELGQLSPPAIKDREVLRDRPSQ